ncbi:MAG: class I SAM-dependent methyltransferase [Pirellulales bacterium]|nr:class I SAM-dependent methyltransferase [Pirellulales bacterium]
MIPDRQAFEDAYSDQAPWDIAGPQMPFVAAADQIVGTVLDSGCGTGENALFVASRGNQVVGIDFLDEPIRRAKQKAIERNLAVRFEVGNALKLAACSESFDNILDCGLFHCFSDDDRTAYVAGLTHVLKPGGRLFLMCFSEAEPGENGPRRVTKSELMTAFASPWVIESIKPTRFEINPNFKGAAQFSPGGPKAWILIARRS